MTQPVTSPSIDPSRPFKAPLREYLEVLAVVAGVTILGEILPLGFRAIGDIYLLAVIVLCLRVGRGPIFFAAVVSALTWNFVIIPPKFSFRVIDVDNVLMLGTYFVVALIAGELISRVRSQELAERRRAQEVTALFHLTRGLAGAHTLDEAAVFALREANDLFRARTALLTGNAGSLVAHPAGSLALGEAHLKVAEWSAQHGEEAGRFTEEFAREGEYYFIPLMSAGSCLGVFVIDLPAEAIRDGADLRSLVGAFAAQIALIVERERWRASSEREKILAVSEQLQRTLLDSVAHELKTPLSVLRSSFEASLRGSEERRAVLDIEIRAAIGRLDRLVANLLNQTRLESGVLMPKFDWHDVRDVIAEARRELGSALDGRAIRIDVPSEMPLVRADGALLEQVIGNLLLNGAMHTPEGLPIAVRAGTSADGKMVFLAIEDRGPGIPPDRRNLLFTRFGRGGPVSSRGLGLGLSIVKGFMIAQGGDVLVSDNPGGGSCFTVTLPHFAHEHVPNE